MEGKEAVFDVILEHFGEVYKSDNPSSMEPVLASIPSLVTADMNEHLLAPVSDLEIKNVVFNMGALRAPGPDGFNGFFYQKIGRVLNQRFVELSRAFLMEDVSPMSLITLRLL